MANFNITVGAKENQAPIVGDGSRNTVYGSPITFTRADFTSNTTPQYLDPDGDVELTLRIDSLPLSGKIQLDGIDVSVAQEIDFTSEIDMGKLTYLPDVNNSAAHNTDFEFSIADAGSGLFSS